LVKKQIGCSPSLSEGFDAGDYNLFRYCHNDPIDNVDPMGLEVEREPWPNHQEQAKALSATEAVWQRQMNFSSSFGAIAYGMAAYAYAQMQQAMSVSVSGLNLSPSGHSQYREAPLAPVNDQYQPMYLKSDRIENTNKWTITPGTKDNDGRFQPVRGEIASRESRSLDHATKGLTVVKNIGSGWAHRADNTIQDELTSRVISGGIKGHSEAVYNQRYEIYLNGLRYFPRTTFQQHYNYNDGVFTGADLVPQN
jgi:hypothetical protein